MRRTNRHQLRVAILLDEFFPASGGIGRSVQTQVHELSRLGCQVTLITSRHQLEKPDDCETIVVPAYYIPGTPAHMCVLKFGSTLASKISREHEFDIIHSQTDRGALILAAKIAKLQKIPHIHTFHSNISGNHMYLPVLAFLATIIYRLVINPILASISIRRTSVRPQLLPKIPEKTSLLERLDWGSLGSIASRVDAFTAPSKFMMTYILSASNGNRPEHKLIPNTYNRNLAKLIISSKPSRDDQKIRFLSVGRLSKEKRTLELTEAFIAAGLPNSELIILGGGDCFDEISKIASSVNNIHLLGHVAKQDQIASELANADVFVLSSYHFDNQPVVVLEAAIAGLPIIYCDERLDAGLTPENSLLTNSPSVEDIAEAIKTMASDTLRKRMSAASKQVVADFTPEKIAESYLSLYKKLLQ